MKLRHLLGLFLLVFVFVSCEKDDIIDLDEETTFGIRHDRSLSEYEDLVTSQDTDLPDFSSVVFFNYSLDGSQNLDFIATGTLIDEDWILTAAHNFYDAEEQNAPAPISGVYVNIGNDPNNPEATYSVSEIILHPTWLSGQQDYDDANDLCLVKLATPITNITPAKLHTDGNEQLGNVAWHCGFGDFSRLADEDPDLFSKKHAVQNNLDRIRDGFQTSTGGTSYPGGLLAFDFDNPDGTINSLGDGIINEDESYLGNGSSTATSLDFEGTTVEGDSGGPLFIRHNNSWEVAGVLSGGASEPIDGHIDGSYGDISIYISVSASAQWILSVIQ